MKLIIQQRSETPIYEQLYSEIVSQILKGKLAANECLPSIRVIARELEISVIPVKTAYEMLEKDGYIYTVQGKGCFVCDLGSDLYRKKQQLVEQRVVELTEFARQIDLPDNETLLMVEKYLGHS